jgi:hypothetical protein
VWKCTDALPSGNPARSAWTNVDDDADEASKSGMMQMMMKRTMKARSTRVTVLATVFSLLIGMPGVALADQHENDHGPMPIAIVGTLFGGALWLVSTPFCAIVAPMHIMDSFDAMVAAPWRMTIGSDAPRS